MKKSKKNRKLLNDKMFDYTYILIFFNIKKYRLKKEIIKYIKFLKKNNLLILN